MNISSKIKRISLSIILAGLFFFPCTVLARENVTDWYIKDLQTEIVVNKDSSLDVTERITADCGNALGKHGIFRILPETMNTGDSITSTPVALESITDFDGAPVRYVESRSYSDKTVTWKIGDPDRTVKGVNRYIIKYHVRNVIRFRDPRFDEFYWNLNGNFWDMEIDNFQAKISLPDEVSNNNATVDYYTGPLGWKGKELAVYRWISPHVLEFSSARTIPVRNGITASVVFPKDIFTPYKFGFFEMYGKYLWLFIPFGVLLLCLYFWWKNGKDPRVDKTVIAEYDVPGKLSPAEMGMLMSNGRFDNKLITAEIINLATRGLVTVKELDTKVIFFHQKDYKLTRKEDAEAESVLNESQKLILKRIFGKSQSKKLSSLRNYFYKTVKSVKKKTEKSLIDKNLIIKRGLQFQTGFVIAGISFIVLSFVLMGASIFLFFSLLIAGLIALMFSFAMPKRTPEGAEINWQIKGFKLFMETVDKHRAEFYEKENIFEKFLPYAIVFGITGIWVKKMKDIYGEDYYASHAPIWYTGTNVGAFSADGLESVINSLSSEIAANVSAPSGSGGGSGFGGGGGAGGGGGGGGGGGW